MKREEVRTVKLVSTFWQVLIHVEGIKLGSNSEGLVISWRANNPVNFPGEGVAWTSTGEMKMNESSGA